MVNPAKSFPKNGQKRPILLVIASTKTLLPHSIFVQGFSGLQMASRCWYWLVFISHL